MPYSREELDWIEAEWAFHLHGRSAFLSREDFAQLQVWDGESVPAEAVIGAMESYFARRSKRAKPRSFVALSHLQRDVAKAVTLRAALRRAESLPEDAEGWALVGEPLHSDPRARLAYDAWRRLRAAAPAPDSAAYLDHFDEERKAYRTFVVHAEEALGGRTETLRAELRERLAQARIEEGSLVWKRAWEHHWQRLVCEAWGIVP